MTAQRFTLTNQPSKGEVFYGVKLYKDGKYLGGHNGVRRTKRVQYFVKDHVDFFLDELKLACQKIGVEIKLVTSIA
jgi:hypothetical protein